mgnify:CR=1 FL=1
MPSVRAVVSVPLIAAACATGAADPVVVEPAPTLTPGDHAFTLEYEGRTRAYLVHVPTAVASGEALPVVLAFHGGGGNAAQFKGSAGLDAVAEREGVLAVYPDGTGLAGLHTWNAGPRCCGSARDQDVDDVGFVRAVVADLVARTPVDAERVFATGHSNGGGMSYRIAHDAPEFVAAVAPVGGAAMGPVATTADPVPLLHIHSVDDPRALYDGGLGPPFPMTNHRVEHRAVPEVLAERADLNRCGGPPEVAETIPAATVGRDAGHWAERLVWPGCTAPLEHWRLHGPGHGWPGHRQNRAREQIVGPSTLILSAADEAWRFFAAVAGAG